MPASSADGQGRRYRHGDGNSQDQAYVRREGCVVKGRGRRQQCQNSRQWEKESNDPGIDLGGGNTLALIGVTKASLSAGDFLFL